MLGSDYKERLEDGKVLLYLRNGIFYARVYRSNRRYIYKSLKTKKLVEARKLAIRLFYEVDIRRGEGLPLQQLSFATVIDEYVKLRQKHYEQSQLVKSTASVKDGVSIHMLRQIKRVVKFWIAYCGKKAIDKIDNSTLQEYVVWRKEYYGKMPVQDRPKNYRLHPADKTLEWEVTLAKTILKYATDRGYRGRAALPTYRFKSAKAIVRPAFTTVEMAQIYRGFRPWIRQR